MSDEQWCVNTIKKIGVNAENIDKDVDWFILIGPDDDGFDLFGDGSITIYFTPGHTPGHQSILVNMHESDPMFFAADACYTEQNLQEGPC